MKRSRLIVVGALAVVTAGFLAGTADASDTTKPSKVVKCPEPVGAGQEIRLKADKAKALSTVKAGKPAKDGLMTAKGTGVAVSVTAKDGKVIRNFQARPGTPVRLPGRAAIHIAHQAGNAITCVTSRPAGGRSR